MKNPLNTDECSLKDWYEKRAAYWEKVSGSERDVIAKLQAILDTIPDALKSSQSLDEMQNLYVDLNSFLEPMSEIVAKSEVEKLAVDQWIEQKKSMDYVDIKQALSENAQKATVSQIEATLTERYQGEEWLVLFLTERWKVYRSKMESGKSYLEAVNNKIIQLRQEYSRSIQQERNSTFKPQV